MGELLESKDERTVFSLLTGLIALCRRLIVFELPTVALINGHCYAGGLMMALSCDWRLMLRDAGDVCLSEVALGKNLPMGIRTLLRTKMTAKALRTSVLTGKKYSCAEAVEAGIIDEMVQGREQLMPRGVAFARELCKFAHNRPNYKRLKYDLYYEVVEEFIKAERDPIAPMPSKL